MRHYMGVRANGVIINIQKFEYGNHHPTKAGHGGYPDVDPNDVNDLSPEAVQVRDTKTAHNDQGDGDPITRLILYNCPCAEADGLCTDPDDRILDSYYDDSDVLQDCAETAVSVDGVAVTFTGDGFQPEEIIDTPATVVEVKVTGLPAGSTLRVINGGTMLLNPRDQNISEAPTGEWKFNVTYPAQGLTGSLYFECPQAKHRKIKLTGFA